MDKLSIFTKDSTGVVNIKTEEGITLDTIVEELGDIKREIKLTRKGHEEFEWEKEVEEAVDIEDLEEEE